MLSTDDPYDAAVKAYLVVHRGWQDPQQFFLEYLPRSFVGFAIPRTHRQRFSVLLESHEEIFVLVAITGRVLWDELYLEEGGDDIELEPPRDSDGGRLCNIYNFCEARVSIEDRRAGGFL